MGHSNVCTISGVEVLLAKSTRANSALGLGVIPERGPCACD